jgi:putative ATP-dependent endonuclease of OLD family
MPISEIRIKHFKAFSDTKILRIGPLTPIVGKNDVGKSAILHALKLFFEPPKRGGIDINDLYRKDSSCNSSIEIAFNPSLLRDNEVKIDAKNKINIVNDNLVDTGGLLRIRIIFSTKSVESFEILIKDVDFKEYHPLALKKQDELLLLLKDADLQAVKSGRETNQEKREILRKYAISKGATWKEAWIDASPIEASIRNILPKFIFFTDSPKYSIGETSVQNQFKGVVERALSGNKNAKEIEENIQKTIQIEFDKLFEKLSHLTSNVTSIEAEAKISWKKAVDGIGLIWGDMSGIALPYESRGAGIRRLFMVAYFQYEVAESIHETSGPQYIFAIEEPEVHLHPGAQRDLEIALKEISSLNNTVIFTTHSPIFASLAPVDNLILVNRVNTAAEASQTPKMNITDIARELGVEASDRLIGKNHIILVEGQGDVECYEIILNELFNNRKTSLNPESVLFLQCGGISNLKYQVTTRRMDEVGLKWTFIIDSDKQTIDGPYGIETQKIIDLFSETCTSHIVLKKTTLENYLDQETIKDVTGINCMVQTYGKILDTNGQNLEKIKINEIKKCSPVIFKKMGIDKIISNSEDSDGVPEWIDIFEKIKNRFGL